MNRHLKRLAALSAGCVASLVFAQTAPAPSSSSASPAPAPISAASATPALTAEDLGSFFDGLVPFAIRRGDIAGGVISVVKDGQVLFTRGYGYADLKEHTPVSPENTLFRPGSTSKLFTWTAVMQQVELGKLDLDKDINEYLDFKIPAYEGKPITLRNIMTHTPGFEDVARDLLPRKPEDVNLERYLKNHIPARIFPPGEIVAYSNYGCGLAGYIVQRVSGERFEAYMQKHIFEPLGMAHSSFEQLLPASLAPMMAKGYKTASDGKPQPFELVDPPPAGALSTTALDMTRFMIAQLQNGRYGDNRILEEKTALLMHSPQYTASPGMVGFDLGFYQEDRNGLRIIGHGGDTNVFHSDLHLLLDKNIGIFMSFNSLGSNPGGAHLIRGAIFYAFLDRYFPHPLPDEPTYASAQADAARVAGSYDSSRRNDSALRPLNLLGQMTVKALPDNTLIVTGLDDYAAQPLHWREVGPLHYREVNGQEKLDFIANPDGSIRYWATDHISPVFLFQRLPAYKSASSVGWLAGLSALIVFVTLNIWWIGALVRRHYRKTLDLSAAQLRSRKLSRLGTLAIVTNLLGWVVLLVAAAATEYDILLDGSIVPWLYVLYVLGVVALIGVLAIVAHTLRSLRSAQLSLWVRIGETLLAVAALYLGWFIWAFGLISFNVRF